MISRNGGLSAATDNHGDMADQASGHIENETAIAIDAIRRRASSPMNVAHQGFIHRKKIDGKIVCRECEEPISEERLAKDPLAARCTECQSTRDALKLQSGTRLAGSRGQRAQ